MKKIVFAAIPAGLLAIIVASIVVSLFAVKVLWAWTVPDIFPGAVKQNLIVGTLSWMSSFKLAVFIGVIVSLFGLNNREKE